MKTVKNNLGLIVITGMMLFAGTVFASGNEMGKDDNLTTSPDKVISVENWMVDNNFWSFEDFSVSSEKALTIESWMSDESHFNGSADVMDSLSDDRMEIEGWMINEFYRENKVSTPAVETGLEIEEWMLNDNFWKK